MKKILTLLLLFTLIGFLSGNQVIITNDYQYIVSTGKTYNFNNGNPSNNVKYDRTNKIQIQNNKVIANPLKYHYAFFWQEDNTFIGYYKTNKGLTTSGAYLGQVNTQSIPLPLNAYSFALVRYDNDYILVNGFTIEELFIDNNLAGVDSDDFNDIAIAELNGLTLNEVFRDSQLLLNPDFTNGTTNWIEFVNGSATINVLNNQLVLTTNSELAILRQTFTSTNDVHFIISNVKNENNLTNIIRTRLGNENFNILNVPISSDFQTVSIKTDGINNFDRVTLGSTSSNTGIITFNYIYLYNLTSLGIDSLTQAQLDTYFSIYQNGVNATYYATDGNVSSVDGYYFAAGKNLFDGEVINNQQLVFSDGSIDTSATRSITKYIAVAPNTEYILWATIGVRVAAVREWLYDENKNPIVNLNSLQGSQEITFSGNNGITFTTPNNAAFIIFTFNTSNFNNEATVVQLEQGGTATTFEAFATPTTTLNLTFLFGIGNEPDKATMDGYYAEYEEYLEYLYVCCNIFATQTISFETIYFDDGVSTEIQRVGSILIFTLIGFTLMIFGFVSRRRIFNLLSIGAFIVLGFLLIDFVGFIIILFGLVFINVYYTFFGEL